MTQVATPGRPFGRLLTAMVTPMTADGGLDLDGARRLATYLVDELGNDGLVLSGTTGESPTTTDAVKDAKCDILAATRVLAETDLVFYSGADEFNLALAAVGASGAVSVVAHAVGREINDMYDAFDAGDTARAAKINQRLAPVYVGM